MNGVQVEDTHAWVDSQRSVVSTQTKDITDPQGRGAQDIGLKGNPVTVRVTIEARIKAFLAEEGAGSQAAEPDDPVWLSVTFTLSMAS